MALTSIYLAVLTVANCPRYLNVGDFDLRCYKEYTASIQSSAILSDNCTNTSNRLNFTAPRFQDWRVRDVLHEFKDLFAGDTAVNPDVTNWDTSRATTFEGMFKGATSFNYPIDKWDVRSVGHDHGSFNDFLKGATAFNQPIVLRATSCASFRSLLEGATSMNSEVTLQGGRSVNYDKLLANASSFNQPLVIEGLDDVASVNMMLLGASAFNQPLQWTSLNISAQTKDVFTGASSMSYGTNCWGSNETPATKCTDPSVGCRQCLPTAGNQPTSVPRGVAVAFALAISAMTTVAVVDGML